MTTRHSREVKRYVEERGKETWGKRIVRGVLERTPILNNVTRTVNKYKHDKFIKQDIMHENIKPVKPVKPIEPIENIFHPKTLKKYNMIPIKAGKVHVPQNPSEIKKYQESPDIIKTDNPEIFKKSKKSTKSKKYRISPLVLALTLGLYVNVYARDSGWQTGLYILKTPPQTTHLINGVSTQINPTSSFITFTTTQTVTFTGVPIATANIQSGQYLVLTTTCTNGLTIPTGSANYMVGFTSPTLIRQNECLDMVFNGTNWVNLSNPNNVSVATFTFSGLDNDPDFTISDSSATFYDSTIYLHGDISHLGDTNTGWLMDTDRLRAYAGGYYGFEQNGNTNVILGNVSTPLQVKMSTVAFRGDGTTDDFSISATSATFSDSVNFSSGVALLSQTMATLKAMVPWKVGLIFYDSDNKSVVVSTGTTAGQFAIIYGGVKPVGW